jgi:hypothetical protein
VAEEELAGGQAADDRTPDEPTEAEVETQERHFLVLLVTILAIELAEAVLGPTLTDSAFVDWLQVIVICVTMYAVGGRRKLTIVALLLGGPVVIARVVSISFTAKESEVATLVLSLIFLGYVAWVIMKAVVRPGFVTTDKIYGAMCVYLLLGGLWAHAYCILEIVEPGSFSFPEQTSPRSLVEQSDYRELENDLGFYSYVTLTTLGYGDITPVSHRARQLSWMQALFGQLFIAVTIARLVGTHVSGSSKTEA